MLAIFTNTGLLPQLSKGAEAMALYKTAAPFKEVGAGRRNLCCAVLCCGLNRALLRCGVGGTARCCAVVSSSLRGHHCLLSALLGHPPAHLLTLTLQTFLKAICANWFVCLAVWQCLGANSFGGKFIACLGPVSAFVCIG